MKFQTVQFSITILFVKQLNVKTVLFQTIQFSISTQDLVYGSNKIKQSGDTTLSHSGPGSDRKEGVLCIPQSTRITGTSTSDCLESYPGYSLVESYPSAEKQPVYSIASAD